jgi:hypothetical protein
MINLFNALLFIQNHPPRPGAGGNANDVPTVPIDMPILYILITVSILAIIFRKRLNEITHK